MLDALLNQEAGETEWRYKSNCFMKGKNGNNGNKSKRKNVDDDEPPTFSNHPLISMEDIFAPEDIISTPPLLNSDDWSFDTSPTSDAVDSSTAPLHHYFQLADPDVYLKTQQVEGKDESTFHQLNTAAYYHDMEPPSSSSSKIDQLSDHNYSHRCSDVDTKVNGEACSLIGGNSSGGGGLLVDVMTSADNKSCAPSTCDPTRGPYMGGLDDISINDLFQHDSLYMPPSCSSISSSVSTACNSPHEAATSSSPHEVAPPTSANDKEAVPVVKHQEYAKKRRRNNEACRESRKKKKSERVENEKLVGELTDDNAQLRLQIKKLEAERDEVRRILMERITKNAATSSSS